jgi:hypothetical protein
MTHTPTAHKKLKNSDRQEILSKVLAALKKKYKSTPPKHSRPVLETMLFATLLEDTPHPDADKAYERMIKAFYDLNEIRVSSVAEIEDAIGPLPDAGWKSLRIREILQHSFEKFFAFDMEPIRRKTLEVAEKSLDKVKYLTPFVREYTLLYCLGAHAVPLSGSMREFLGWLGLVAPDNPKTAIEDIRSAVRKADVPVFLHLVHAFTADPHFHGVFRLKPSERSVGGDPSTAMERLNAMLASGGKRPVAKTIPKPGKPAAKAAAPRNERKPAGRDARKVAKAKPAKASKRR